MNTLLEKQLETNQTLVAEIIIMWNKFSERQKEITPSDGNRKMLLTSYYAISFEHYKAMIRLINYKHYNSAFALIRVLFENVVRAYYVYECISSDKIDKLILGDEKKFFPDMSTMCVDVDKKYDIDYFSQVQNIAWDTMNSYTHTGVMQLQSMMDEEKSLIGTANFSADKLKNTLEISYQLMRLFSCMFFKAMGYNKNDIIINNCDAMLSI